MRQNARPSIDVRYHHAMPITLPLNEMTIPEKLQLMEALWADLSREPESLESPSWHQDILEERERRIASGQADFTNWKQAKEDIRKRVS
jgi:hypothetical protein